MTMHKEQRVSRTALLGIPLSAGLLAVLLVFGLHAAFLSSPRDFGWAVTVLTFLILAGASFVLGGRQHVADADIAYRKSYRPDRLTVEVDGIFFGTVTRADRGWKATTFLPCNTGNGGFSGHSIRIAFGPTKDIAVRKLL